MKHIVKGCLIKFNQTLCNGKIVRPEAFKEADGSTIPVVADWILKGVEIGTAKLEWHEDGIYYTAELDDLEETEQTIDKIRYHTYRFRMFANRLREQDQEILHGEIQYMFAAAACDGAAFVTEIDGEPLKYSQEKLDELKVELGNLSARELLLESIISKKKHELQKVQNKIINIQYILEIYDKENNE